jgi:hypothetical protein
MENAYPEFMKWKTLILALAVSCWSTAHANVVSLTYTNDGDGAINCVYNGPTSGFNANDITLCATGEQFRCPGHMWAVIETDSTLDPSITFRNIIDNATGFNWISYQVDVYLTAQFTVVSAAVNEPSDWTVSYNPSSTWNGSYWEDVINYQGGTPVSGDPNNPGTLDFSYKITFSGATSYTFLQQLTPVPEPSTAGIWAFGTLLCGFAARRLRR